MTAGRIARLTEPQRLAFFIALGIGFHNFSEGLAIGQSAAAGEVSLALLLIIGFGLHNATEGFGIVAPMAAEGERPIVVVPPAPRPHRRRAHVRRHPHRPVVRERHDLHGVSSRSPPARSSTS